MKRLLPVVLVLVAACSSSHPTAKPAPVVHRSGPFTSGLAGVILGDCNQPGSPTRAELPAAERAAHFGDQTGPGTVGIAQWADLVGVSSPYVNDYFAAATMSSLRYENYTIDCWKTYLAAHPEQHVIYALPMLSDEQFPGHPDGQTMVDETLAGFKAGVAGSFDEDFQGLARELVAAGQDHALLRLGWEMNCRCSRWAADVDPPLWVHYWRHIVTLMRAVPGAHFTFVWNVNNGYNNNDFVDGHYVPGSGEFNGEAAYPDDPTIDPGSFDASLAPYVGMVSDDLYDDSYVGDGKGALGYPMPAHASAKQIAKSQALVTALTLYGDPHGRVGHAQRHSAEWWREFANAHGKPFGVNEWGLERNPDQPATGPYPGPTLDCTDDSSPPAVGSCHGGGDDPTFIDGFLAWASSTYTSQHGSTPVSFAEYFDGSSASSAHPGAGTDNRIDTAWTTRSLARLKVGLQDAAAAGH